MEIAGPSIGQSAENDFDDQESRGSDREWEARRGRSTEACLDTVALGLYLVHSQPVKEPPMVAPLAPGATMPAVFAKDLEGNDVDIVASVAGNWAIIQFYRGDW